MGRRLVIATVLCLALGRAAVASAEPQQPSAKKVDLSGVYLCEGTNPDGQHYRGIVQIASVQNTYLVRWTLSDDIEVTGVGIVQDGLLAVSYFGGTPAVVIYRVDAERLVGEWTMGGAEGMVYAEILTRVPEDKLPKPAPKPKEEPRRPTRPPAPVGGARSI